MHRDLSYTRSPSMFELIGITSVLSNGNRLPSRRTLYDGLDVIIL